MSQNINNRKNKSSLSDDVQHPQIVLVGQPNCGKSTIFNRVAGYRSVATNFPGATVEFTRSHVKVNGQTCDLVDLPGTYSLQSLDLAEEEAKKFLLMQRIDVIINVIDASILGRSLDLTTELLELELPLVVCLNMMDEATRKGVLIQSSELAELLDVPVIETIGSKGHGIDELFRQAFQIIRSNRQSHHRTMSRHVEKVIQELSDYLPDCEKTGHRKNCRLTAIKLIENDPYFQKRFSPGVELKDKVRKCRKKLQTAHGLPAEEVIAAERHSLALGLFEKVAKIGRPKKSWKDWADDVLMHPIFGYVFMTLFLYAFFNVIFKFGALIENPILNFFNVQLSQISHYFPKDSFLFTLINGLFQGFAGGIAIVFPYLVPFLLGLAFIEDFGYLPRIAFLMDRFMHKIGLHGPSIVPVILGYGCSVPAVLSTRILSSPRDRFIASVVSVLIPCSARMTIIMGLVGYFLGGTAALGIYLLNLIVIGIVGTVLSRMMPEDIPGMILEMPSYQWPSLRVVVAKTWLRLKDFIVIAWPLLIAGSIVLSVAEWYHIDALINKAFSPLTSLLGLPAAVGTTLIFGILRKELSMLMLFQALGTTDVSAVLSSGQILVFTLFVVFYIPCLATLGVLWKEMGWRKTLFASGLTIFIALFISLLGRAFSYFVF